MPWWSEDTGATTSYRENQKRIIAAMESGSTNPSGEPLESVTVWQTSPTPNPWVPTQGPAFYDPGLSFENQADALFDDPNFLSPTEKAWIEKQTQAWYGYSTPVSDAQKRGFWKSAFTTAALRDIPVYDVMANMVSAATKDRSAGTDTSGGGGGGGYGGTTYSYDYTAPDVAKNLINVTLSNYLGRAARNDEVKNFTEALKAAESENPVIVTTDGSTRTQSGGMNAELFAKEYALQQEGAAEYQASTKYLDLFLGALT